MLGTLVALQVLPDGPPPDVFIVGDSVTFLSATAIQDRFDVNHIQFVARPGFTSTMLLPLVDQAMAMSDEPAHARQRIAVLVGYNDVRIRDVGTPSMRKLVDRAAEFECGIFLTLPARPGGKDNPNPMADSDQVDVWNALLRKEVGRHPTLHVVEDWADTVNRSPKGELLKDDGVHPNDAGAAVLADVYHQGLDHYC